MRPTGVAAVRGAAAALLAVAAASGCSGEAASSTPSSSVAPHDIPACTEVYTQGLDVTRAEFGVACLTDSGRLESPRPIRIECEDGRQLLWNQFGWGFLGEPMTVTPAEEVSKIPQEALNDCLSGPGGGGGAAP
jgi:hypothetical protein